jgi:hypothetical protein
LQSKNLHRQKDEKKKTAYFYNSASALSTQGKIQPFSGLKWGSPHAESNER